MSRRDASVARSMALRLLAVVVLAQTVAVLPVFLLGGLAPMVGADLVFDERGLGAAVAIFFAVSAVGSAPLGRLGQRVGASVAMRLSALGSAAVLLALGLGVRNWLGLMILLAVGGLANAFMQPATNQYLAEGVRSGSQGLAFGVKQSSIPLASLLGGAAVPLVGVTVGWRWAFAGAGVIALVALFGIPKRSGHLDPGTSDGATAALPMPGLLALAVAAGFGAMGANAMAAFLVQFAVAGGGGEGAAGVLLAAGGLCAVTVRVVSGWWVDAKSTPRLLPVVGVLFALGGVGYLLLALGTVPVTLVVGTVLAFGAGWGWSGLLVLAVVRVSRGQAGTATGITQAGVFVGAVVGPLGFGWTVAQWSYLAAWSAAAVTAGIAAALVLIAHHLLQPDTAPAAA